MTTTVKPKKAEGIIIKINPTSVEINDTLTLKDKTIYLPQERRTYFASQNYKEGDNVRLIYDRDGNYIDSERLPKRDLTKSEHEKIDHVVGSGGGESHTALEPEHSEMHIEKETASGPKGRVDQSTSGITPPNKIAYMHIQKDNVPAQAPQQHWMTEREKNDTIVIQSLLARAVDIVDAVTKEFPKTNIVNEKTDFADSLDARINNIECVTDRLFEYVKKKVSDKP